MVLSVNHTELKAFNQYKDILSADPAPLMLALAEQDKRLYFTFCISRKRFLYTNAAFKTFFADIINEPPAHFLHYIQPEDVDDLKQYIAEMQAGVARNNIELNVNLPHKKECRLKLNLMYHQEPDGNSAVIGYAEEIISHKMQTTVSEEYHHQKRMILDILSHDLLGPMGSIQNLAALLFRKSDLKKDPEVSKWVALIEDISKKSINRIRNFVEKEFTEQLSNQKG